MHVLTNHQSDSRGLLHWADSSADSLTLPMKALHTLLRFSLITYREFRKNDLTLRSAALTYTILLSLVPVLAMSTAIVKGLGGGDQLREVAYSYIDTLEQNSFQEVGGYFLGEPATPSTDTLETQQSGLTTHLRNAADSLFDYVDKTNFATLGSLGVAGIFLSVIMVFVNIELALNTIWHVKNSRSITRKITDYLTLIVLLPISVNVTFAASAFLANPTLASKFQMIIPFIWMQTLILKLVPVFFIGLTFYVIYIFFPNTKVHSAPALLGAFFAATLWFVMQNIYISLQIGVSNYNAIYGSFATLPLFLVWMYLGWLFILGGAQIAYVCQNIRTYRLTTEPTEPSRRLSAAFDIMDSVQKSFIENQPVTTEDLKHLQPGYSPALIQDVTNKLVQAELLHISRTGTRLLPGAPNSSSNHQSIIRTILGTSTPNTPGGKASELAISAAATQSLDVSPEASGAESGSGNLQEGPSST